MIALVNPRAGAGNAASPDGNLIEPSDERTVR